MPPERWQIQSNLHEWLSPFQAPSSNVQKSWKLLRKARGAGAREGTSSFSATTNFSKSRASYFRLACLRDVLLSESLAQATCDHLPKKSYHLPRTTPHAKYQWLKHSRNLSCTTTISLSCSEFPVRFSPGGFGKRPSRRPWEFEDVP